MRVTQIRRFSAIQTWHFSTDNVRYTTDSTPMPMSTQLAMATLRCTPALQCASTAWPSWMTDKAASTPLCRVRIGIGVMGESIVGSHSTRKGGWFRLLAGFIQCMERTRRMFRAKISSTCSASGQAEMNRYSVIRETSGPSSVRLTVSPPDAPARSARSS